MEYLIRLLEMMLVPFSDFSSLSFVLFFSLLFLFLFRLGEIHGDAYVYPNFKISTLIVGAFVIGPYAVIRLITMSDPGSIFFALLFGLIFGCFLPSIFIKFLRRPKHNQKEAITFPLGEEVSKLINTTSESFPEVSKECLWVHRGISDVMDRTFSVLPDPTAWRSGFVSVGPIVTMAQIERIAKELNGKTDGIRVNYENGIPFLYTEK